MSFQAKSNLVMFVIIAVVYGLYFAVVLSWAQSTSVEDISYQPLLVLTVVPVVVLAIIAHILLAIVRPSEAGQSDERDRLIDLRGESIGGVVLAVVVFGAIFLAMAEAHQFWLAQTLVAGIVVAQLAKEGVTVFLSVRGS